MASNGKILDLLEQEVEDFIQTQAEKIVSFEDDPMAYILNKYPSLNDTLTDLMTKHFGDYVMGIYVMAPKPTTFKILLHNGQFFYLTYAKESYIAKIQGKKYYLLDLGAEEYAIKAIADLLTMGKPPGAKGPDDQEDNVTITDTETEVDVKDEEGEEELSEDKFSGEDPKAGSTIQGTGFNAPRQKSKSKKSTELDDYGRPFVDPKGSRTYMDPDEMTPAARARKMMGEKKIKIIRENKVTKKNPSKFRIIKEGKAEDRDEAKNILKKELSLSDSDFKDSGLNFYVLVPNKERQNTVDKIESINTGTDKEFEYTPTPTSFSSIGYFMYGQSKFGVKPTEKQGGKSAGLDNEDVFISEINNLLQDGPKNIKITSGENTVDFNNVTKVIGTGLSTGEYSKSDANFYNGEKDLGGVSIKKDNAIFWESADVRFSQEVKNLVDAITSGKLGDEISYVPLKDTRGNPDPVIIRMYNKKENKPIAGIIVDDLPEQDIQQVIFGNDEVPVIKRTFKPSDFKVEGNTIVISVSKIYEDLDDIEKDGALPVLNIRHDKTRRSSRGLRALLQTQSSVLRDGNLIGNNIKLPHSSFN